MKRRIGGIRGPDGETWIPIFCANCGASCGKVPEKHITFTFALCDPCSAKYGDVAHVHKEPDHVFWKRVHEAQLEEEGHVLNPLELAKALDDPTTLMARLAEEWRRHVLKAG
jgi:hypothetical protein